MSSVRLRRKGRREHSAPAEPERHGTREERPVNGGDLAQQSQFRPRSRVGRPCWETSRRMSVLLPVLLSAAAVLALALGYRLHVRRSLERRVAAEAGRIAGEWASRSELAALLDPDELLEHTLAEVASLPGVDAALAVLD